MHGALRLPPRITSPCRRRASPNPCRTPPSPRRAPPGSDGDGTGDGRWRRPPCLSSFTHYTGKKRYVHNAAFARKACVWRMRAFPLLCTHAGASAALRARRRNVIEASGRSWSFATLHARRRKRSKPSLLRRFAAYRGEDAETRYNLVQTEDDKQGRRKSAGAGHAEAARRGTAVRPSASARAGGTCFRQRGIPCRSRLLK